jgi:lipopolysaccharide export system permease protein
MVKFIDRQLILSFFKAYVVCLVSMLSLYIVVDLFTNLDDFTSKRTALPDVLTQIARYYCFKVPAIFDRLCEVIVLLAATFTIAWMQRNNELLPLLSAGVSTHRIILPIIVSACVMLSLACLNQELLIPQLGDRIMSQKEDPDNQRNVLVNGKFEGTLMHIEGQVANRKEKVIEGFDAVIREGVFRNMVHLSAREARYIPPGQGPRTGGWLLTDIRQSAEEIVGDENQEILEQISEPGDTTRQYFLHTKEVDFDAVTRSDSWYQLAATHRLFEELKRTDSPRQSQIAVLFHMRLTRPILGILLVVMGLATILRDQNRNVFLSAGMCLVLCGMFFLALFLCRSLGDHTYLTPPLAAWVPVIFFGPFAFVLLDLVHT